MKQQRAKISIFKEVPSSSSTNHEDDAELLDLFVELGGNEDHSGSVSISKVLQVGQSFGMALSVAAEKEDEQLDFDHFRAIVEDPERLVRSSNRHELGGMTSRKRLSTTIRRNVLASTRSAAADREREREGSSGTTATPTTDSNATARPPGVVTAATAAVVDDSATVRNHSVRGGLLAVTNSNPSISATPSEIGDQDLEPGASISLHAAANPSATTRPAAAAAAAAVALPSLPLSLPNRGGTTNPSSISSSSPKGGGAVMSGHSGAADQYYYSSSSFYGDSARDGSYSGRESSFSYTLRDPEIQRTLNPYFGYDFDQPSAPLILSKGKNKAKTLQKQRKAAVQDHVHRIRSALEVAESQRSRFPFPPFKDADPEFLSLSPCCTKRHHYVASPAGLSGQAAPSRTLATRQRAKFEGVKPHKNLGGIQSWFDMPTPAAAEKWQDTDFCFKMTHLHRRALRKKSTANVHNRAITAATATTTAAASAGEADLRALIHSHCREAGMRDQYLRELRFRDVPVRVTALGSTPW